MPTISSGSDPSPIGETLWVFEATGDCGALDAARTGLDRSMGVDPAGLI
jgi:hypothetical protein